MKFTKWLFLEVTIFCLPCFLHGNNTDGQCAKEQIENAQSLFSLVDSLTTMHQKYFQKNTVNLKIRCAQCHTREISVNEFEGGLIGWTLKVVTEDKAQFEKIKLIFTDYIKLLSEEASSAEILNFMLKISNEMNQICSHCHGTAWERA
ncbi:MAG: hypothetical protein WC365_01670 [Candidatus Babeliales bacterium]|jgi:hypothetical protein